MKPTRDDALIQIEGIPEDRKNALMAVRLIVAACARPEVRFDVEALSKATNLSLWQVRQVLQSRPFAALIADQCENRLHSVRLRLIDKIAALMEGETSITKLAQAGRYINETSKLLADLHTRGPVDQAAEEEACAKQLRAINRLRSAEGVKIYDGYIGEAEDPEGSQASVGR